VCGPGDSVSIVSICPAPKWRWSESPGITTPAAGTSVSIRMWKCPVFGIRTPAGATP